MKDICTCTLNIELTGDDHITGIQNAIEKTIFRCSVGIRKRLRASTDTATREALTTMPKTPGAKLPKLEVPTFDGDLLKWKSFWDQFHVSIHNRADLTNAEKMVYLQKDNTAKRTNEVWRTL